MDDLPLESKAELAIFRQQVASMSPEQMREMLVRLREAMLIQHHTTKQLLGKKWGIGT